MIWHQIYCTLLSKSGSRNQKSSCEEELVVLLLTQQKRRWFRVHRCFRAETGELSLLIQDFKLCHCQFRTYFRMSVGQFEILLGMLAKDSWETKTPNSALISVCSLLPEATPLPETCGSVLLRKTNVIPVYGQIYRPIVTKWTLSIG